MDEVTGLQFYTGNGTFYFSYEDTNNDGNDDKILGANGYLNWTPVDHISQSEFDTYLIYTLVNNEFPVTKSNFGFRADSSHNDNLSDPRTSSTQVRLFADGSNNPRFDLPFSEVVDGGLVEIGVAWRDSDGNISPLSRVSDFRSKNDDPIHGVINQKLISVSEISRDGNKFSITLSDGRSQNDIDQNINFVPDTERVIWWYDDGSGKTEFHRELRQVDPGFNETFTATLDLDEKKTVTVGARNKTISDFEFDPSVRREVSEGRSESKSDRREVSDNRNDNPGGGRRVIE
jgi:hypothetical protein